jgi:hypothetical protein
LTGRIPARFVAGGEGGEAWELQGFMHYLLVGSGRGGGGRRCGATVSFELAGVQIYNFGVVQKLI